jgi:hypothetical protein
LRQADRERYVLEDLHARERKTLRAKRQSAVARELGRNGTLLMRWRSAPRLPAPSSGASRSRDRAAGPAACCGSATRPQLRPGSARHAGLRREVVRASRRVRLESSCTPLRPSRGPRAPRSVRSPHGSFR